MIRTLKKSDGNLTTNRKEIAQLLADQFKATSHDSKYSADFVKRRKREELQTIFPELGQGEEYNLPLFRSRTCEREGPPGPDDVHCKMLKQLPPVSKPKLLEIYNEIWEREVFPKS
jgi:hypothetical protein